MKRVFFKLSEWIRSFFSKKSVEKAESSIDNSMDVEVNIAPTASASASFINPTYSENPWNKKSIDELVSEPEINKNALDLNVEEPKMKFNTLKNQTLTINSGETFELTEKQLIFYRIINTLQEIGEASSQNILWAYLKHKHSNLSHEEVNEIFKSQKFSSHNKTLKGMFKSGLLERVSRNEYRVRV